MTPNLLMLIIMPVLLACQSHIRDTNEAEAIVSTGEQRSSNMPVQRIADIQLPSGYARLITPRNSFATWLRDLPLKTDSRVYLYNGELKRNQSAQFAVLDVPVGKRDLQQCADAIMRLRAQYLFDQQRFGEICFADNNGKKYQYRSGDRLSFDKYLERVFSFCGTLSLEKQLKKTSMMDIHPGDVLIQGGSPGHAVIVVDVAVNKSGKRIFMLAQSYMPAQDIHILKNPEGSKPWFVVNSNPLIHTPEWTFTQAQLRTW